jgi:hypothetical protein
MKSLFVAATLIVAASFYSVPSFAVDATAGVSPPECANPDTQTKHPDWYRPGGYCTPNDGDQAGSGPASQEQVN